MTSHNRMTLGTTHKRAQRLSLLSTIVALGCAGGGAVDDTGSLTGTGGAASGGAILATGGSAIGGNVFGASGGAFSTGGGALSAGGGVLSAGGVALSTGGASTGGTTGTGGDDGAGGIVGAGGNVGTGGIVGAGGNVGVGGSGSGGAPVEPCVVPQEEVCGTGSIISLHCGLTYELWSDAGSACMTNTAEGFLAGWNGNNYIARVGLRPTANQTVVDPVITYTASYTTNGTSYLTVYGWTTDPLVEFYILEAHDPAYRPPGNGPDVTSYPDVQANGGTYQVRRSQRTNQPSIIGTASFPQFWSLRTQNRTSGTINVAEHFAAWEQAGLEMGDIYEISMAVEGFRSSGNADVKVTFE
jgi:endo-1,4-beta-xylanase